MTIILVSVHIMIAIALIIVVLIQRGQGSDMGASFGGGGAQTLFGSRGSGSFLGKLTGGLAAGFMLTSLTLAFFSQQQAGSSVLHQETPAAVEDSLPAADGGAPAFDPASLRDTSGAAKPTEDALPAAQ